MHLRSRALCDFRGKPLSLQALTGGRQAAERPEQDGIGQDDGTGIDPRSDGIRCGDRRRRPVRPGRRDPPETACRGKRQRDRGLRPGKGLGGRRAYPVRRRARPAGAERTAAGLAGPGRPGQHAGERGPLFLSLGKRRVQGAEPVPARLLLQPWLLYHQPGQPVPLAGRTGRGHGRGDLPRLRRRRGALRRAGPGPRRRDRRHGHRRRRCADGKLHAGHGAAGQIHLLRGRLPRLPRQTVNGPVRPVGRRRSAVLRYRHQGIVGNRSGAAQGGPGHAHSRLAARPGDLRRLLPVSFRREPGVGRLRRRAGLQEPLSQPP